MGAFDQIAGQLANFNGMAVGIAELNCMLCLVTCIVAAFFRKMRQSGPCYRVLVLIIVQCCLYAIMHSSWESAMTAGVVSISFIQNSSWSFLEASYFALITTMVCERSLSDAKNVSRELLSRVEHPDSITSLFGATDKMPRKNEMASIGQIFVGMTVNFTCCLLLAAIMLVRNIS